MDVQKRFDDGDFDAEYADYIIEHCGGGDRLICNGDMLIDAMEDGYLAVEFVEWYSNKS